MSQLMTEQVVSAMTLNHGELTCVVASLLAGLDYEIVKCEFDDGKITFHIRIIK